MSSEVLAAIIGAGALMIGAFIQSNINIFGFIKYLRKKTFKFHCEWQILEPQELAKSINDTITLTIFRNRTVEGEGCVPELGKYIIKGVSSDYCLALYFSGIKDKNNLAGVIFIKKTPIFDNLNGFWTQLDQHGNVLDGTVVLRRINE